VEDLLLKIDVISSFDYEPSIARESTYRFSEFIKSNYNILCKIVFLE